MTTEARIQKAMEQITDDEIRSMVLQSMQKTIDKEVKATFGKQFASILKNASTPEIALERVRRNIAIAREAASDTYVKLEDIFKFYLAVNLSSQSISTRGNKRTVSGTIFIENTHFGANVYMDRVAKTHQRNCELQLRLTGDNVISEVTYKQHYFNERSTFFLSDDTEFVMYLFNLKNLKTPIDLYQDKIVFDLGDVIAEFDKIDDYKIGIHPKPRKLRAARARAQNDEFFSEDLDEAINENIAFPVEVPVERIEYDPAVVTRAFGY